MLLFAFNLTTYDYTVTIIIDIQYFNFYFVYHATMIWQ
jgi:hypothetical protein